MQGKNVREWVFPFSCNFMKNVKQCPAVLFAHCRGEISVPNVKIMNNSINILYFEFHLENSGFVFTRMVIPFIKLGGPSKTGKGRKLRQLITGRPNTVSEL